MFGDELINFVLYMSNEEEEKKKRKPKKRSLKWRSAVVGTQNHIGINDGIINVFNEVNILM